MECPPVIDVELLEAKTKVVLAAFGLCSLSEAELLRHLEMLYWKGFAAGCVHMGAKITPEEDPDASTV